MRYLLLREGRYYARLVVPKDLRPLLEGKTELRVPLGADYREAVKRLPGAVTELQHRIATAERLGGRFRLAGGTARYPLRPEVLARSLYLRRLAFDAELRDDPRYHIFTDVDDGHVADLRAGIAGRATDNKLEELVGDQLGIFRQRGNFDEPKGSAEWRAAARALCVAELEALARVLERHDGDWSGKPEHPMLVEALAEPEPLPPVSIKGLFAAYIKSRAEVGRGRSIEARWPPVVTSLVGFLKHDDAGRVTKADLLGWRDKLLETLSAKTVADVHLAAVRAVWHWAVDNDRLPANVAQGVRQAKAKAVRVREQGYTDDEARALLKAARAYTPKAGATKSTTEGASLTRAKRWVPWLCAFTGARVTEITQLRGQDFSRDGGSWVLRINPEAGSVKSGNFRDVPLHPQLLEIGFADVLEAAGDGPLFYQGATGRDPLRAARMVSGRISEWVRSLKVAPASVAPSHGWRHRFKTVALDVGIAGRVIDALQDHAPRTAGEAYGDVSLVAKRRAIEALPRYAVD